MDDAEFDRLVAGDELLEWASFAGNRYGTPREPVLAKLAAGEPVLLEIELQGARQIRASMPEAIFVFLAPPSWDVLVQRLTGRGPRPRRRSSGAWPPRATELAAGGEFDVILVNDVVEDVAAKLVTLMGFAD